MIGATNGSFGAVWGVLLVVVRGVIGATVGFFGVDLGSWVLSVLFWVIFWLL